MTMSIPEIAARAKEQLTALTGLKASTVSSLSHSEGGWHIVADLIELKRIPESSDVLATYEVTLDDKGNLLSYQRTRRYTRGQINSE
jgi:Gas vesicle synthesis protein GvpO